MTRKRLVAGFIALSIILCGTFAWRLHITPATTEQPTQKPTEVRTHTPQHASRSLNPSEPTQLQIPSLNINTPVLPVGQTKTGEMEAPKDRNVTGWYKYGYLPGSLGNAVIAGHSWHTTGRGIFASLEKIMPGDTIRLTTSTHIQEYVARELKTFNADHPLTEDIFGASTKSRLNLVTCTGGWDKEARRYKDRLVVFSEFVREDPISESKP